jgi:hypothetical protein
VQRDRWFRCGATRLIALSAALLYASCLIAQVRPAPSVSDRNTEEIHEQLSKLLRMSPKLEAVVANDPSLLSNQEYVASNNPELSQFLQNHPEVIRNPEFYLFTNGRGGSFGFRVNPGEMRDPGREVRRDVSTLLGFGCVLGALLWVFRVLLENRRWGRMFKVQTDISNKLLDKFSSNEELLNYVRSGVGKRFLESVSIPINARSTANAAMSRVLTPLQVGVVVLMVGAGFLCLHFYFPDEASLVILGTLGVVLGLGFIVSGGLGWALARHFRLLPKDREQQDESGQDETPPQL